LSEEGRAMGESQEFVFEGVASRAEAADVLRRVADGLRAGSLSLSMGGESIGVSPEGELTMDIEARQKRTKATIEISIAWKRGRPDDE
jgi:amphi-Trp domain-containing protein